MSPISSQLVVFCLFSVLFGQFAFGSNSVLEESQQDTSGTGAQERSSMVTFPMFSKRTVSKREYVAEAGLGDWDDSAYSVIVEIGGTIIPIIVDTGSSDLWVISDACIDNCPKVPTVPRYSQASFNTSAVDSLLFYGDSTSSTHAFGIIGSDTVTLAGLKLERQYFSAVNNTNTTVLQMGSSGLLGLGFPTNSIILDKVFGIQQANESQDKKLEWLKPLVSDITNTPMEIPSSNKLSSFLTLAPFIPRLVAARVLTQPMFSMTLQRNAIDPGSGNSGLLTLGSTPDNLTEADMAWANVRLYTPEQGGFRPTAARSNEIYPKSWEIMIEDVYLDGELLPKTNLTPPSIGISALVDTGNSYIRGPSDIVDYIFSRVSVPPTPSHSFPCTSPHILAFKINGTLFPVDPRDIVTQFHTINDLDADLSCSLTIAATDTPTIVAKGPLYSWSLGAPFLKSVKAAFYYGNLTHPSVDPPRIGLVSSVPEDAIARMRSVAVAAEHRSKRLPVTSEPAPRPSRQPRVARAPGTQQVGSQSNSARILEWSNLFNTFWLCVGWALVRYIL